MQALPDMRGKEGNLPCGIVQPAMQHVTGAAVHRTQQRLKSITRSAWTIGHAREAWHECRCTGAPARRRQRRDGCSLPLTRVCDAAGAVHCRGAAIQRGGPAQGRPAHRGGGGRLHPGGREGAPAFMCSFRGDSGSESYASTEVRHVRAARRWLLVKCENWGQAFTHVYHP